MKHKFIYLLTLLILFSFTSCKVMFTQAIRDQVEEYEIDVSQIQFYTSRTIILQRVVTSTVTVEDTAKLKQIRQIELERIKICRNTPCVCIDTTETGLHVIFEQADSSSLEFVLTDIEDKSALYKIGALRWNGEIGIVPYNNNNYELRPRKHFFQPNSKEAALKVKRRFLYKWKVKLRRLKGVKLNK